MRLRGHIVITWSWPGQGWFWLERVFRLRKYTGYLDERHLTRGLGLWMVRGSR